MYNCSEQTESLTDATVRTDLRCDQTPSAQPIFMGLRIISVKLLEATERIKNPKSCNKIQTMKS